MARKNTGTVAWMFNPITGKMQWHARWSLGKGKRTPKYVPIGADIPEHDRGAALADSERWAPTVRAAHAKSYGKGEHIEAYSKRWLDEREPRVNSIRDDRSRMRDHVLPILGPLDVRTVTRDDVERVRDDLDAKIIRGELAWKTVASVWTLVTSMCKDMASAKKRAFRVREDNPARDVKPPERGGRKAKQYLYPSEFLSLVSSDAVPLRWRRLFAIAIYTYMRAGELKALDWTDVDLEHRTIHVHKSEDRVRKREVKSTKSGVARRIPIEPELLPLLQALHDARGGARRVFKMPSTGVLSSKLRFYLGKADVKRAELHDPTATSKAITFHDLRATGTTWCAVRGDDPLKIMQRAGHEDYETTKIYVREAENLREGFGEPFPPLPAPMQALSHLSYSPEPWRWEHPEKRRPSFLLKDPRARNPQRIAAVR
jgi:integrase